MKISKSLLTSVLCVSMLIPAVSCSSSDDTVITKQSQIADITLSWWGNDTRNEYTIEGVRRFMELHPEINVKCSYSEWSGYESRSRVQMVSNTEADVMQINYGWLEQYSPDGKGYYDIESVADYIDLTAFDEKMLEYGRVDGILNAIPIAMNVESIYINKTVYDKYRLSVPTTWSDFFNAAEVMSPDEVYALSGADKSVWLMSVAYAEQASGKQILTDDGKLNFTDAELGTMIDFYVRLVNSKVIPQTEYFDRLNLNDGSYAGTVAWVSDAKNYCGSAVENGYNMIVADYTKVEGVPSGLGWYSKPATMYAISANTQHPKEAAMLLDFLLNSPEMAKLQGIEKGIPLSTSARAALEEEGQLSGLQYDASLKMEENDNLKPIDPIIENGDMVKGFGEACNLVLYDKATLEEASAQLRDCINGIINK